MYEKIEGLAQRKSRRPCSIVGADELPRVPPTTISNPPRINRLENAPVNMATQRTRVRGRSNRTETYKMKYINDTGEDRRNVHNEPVPVQSSHHSSRSPHRSYLTRSRDGRAAGRDRVREGRSGTGRHRLKRPHPGLIQDRRAGSDSVELIRESGICEGFSERGRVNHGGRQLMESIPKEVSRSSLLLPAIHSPHQSCIEGRRSPREAQYSTYPNSGTTGSNPPPTAPPHINKPPPTSQSDIKEFISKLDSRIVACLTAGDKSAVVNELLELRKSLAADHSDVPDTYIDPHIYTSKRAKTPLNSTETQKTKKTDDAVLKSATVPDTTVTDIQMKQLDMHPKVNSRTSLPTEQAEGYECGECVSKLVTLKSAIDKLSASWVESFSQIRAYIENGGIDITTDLYLLPALLDEFQPDKYIMIIPVRDMKQKRRQVRSFQSYMSLIPVYKNKLLKLADQYKRGDGKDEQRLNMWIEFNRSFRLLLRWYASKYMFICLDNVLKVPPVPRTQVDHSAISLIRCRTNTVVSNSDQLVGLMQRFIALYQSKVAMRPVASNNDSFASLAASASELSINPIIKNKLVNYCSVLQRYTEHIEARNEQDRIRKVIGKGEYIEGLEEVNLVLANNVEWDTLEWSDMDPKWLILSFVHKRRAMTLLRVARNALASMEMSLRCMRADNQAKKFEMYNLTARYIYWRKCKHKLDKLVNDGLYVPDVGEGAHLCSSLNDTWNMA